jgi:hypothetical protein
LKISHLLLPRAQIQISEADHPGVTPESNTTVVAPVRDDDVEAIGDANGQLVVCTRSATYNIGASASPIGVLPDISSDKFGCIAPNSMVTFESGCAWISERGPVASIGGVVQHIGESLERHFVGETARYLRDGMGMMRHAWGCHDAERSLIYFGVYAGRAGTTVTGSTPSPLTVSFRGATYNWEQAGGAVEAGVPVADKVKSLFPCDEILVYSYKNGTWSFWRPPLNLGVQWMTRGTDSVGNARVFFLDSDKRLNAFDDA